MKEKHGNTAANGFRTPIYQAWLNMRRRCSDSRHPQWPNYGGRGIKVCDRWLHSFTAFLADAGNRPEGRWLDRINNEGGYWCGYCEECARLGRPRNTRWATPTESARNRRPPRRKKKRRRGKLAELRR